MPEQKDEPVEDEWIREFRKWAASHRPLKVLVNYDRGELYNERLDSVMGVSLRRMTHGEST